MGIIRLSGLRELIFNKNKQAELLLACLLACLLAKILFSALILVKLLSPKYNDIFRL